LEFIIKNRLKAANNTSGAISRREFLRLGAVGVGSAGVATFARAGAAGARCDSVILLWMAGGVSHLDTFDPKPDAPAEIRGPFKAIATNVPGIQLCEHLPRLARMADKIAFIRSMHHGEGAHECARSLMLTGWERLGSAWLPGDDVSRQDAREAYGASDLGDKCLLARRLVEGGARFVMVEENGWDHHFRAFDSLANRLPVFDRAVSALIGDLAVRGLLDRTLVVFATEFGRSPRINGEAGREHHPAVFSCFLAGGGIRGGQVIGASDARGEMPAENPITPEDLVRTVWRQLGVNALESGAVIRGVA
jgi:uncharacterized protein (DUF1501 family)